MQGVLPLGGACVVDFGGGSGSLAVALGAHVGSVLCLDESADAAAECASRAAEQDLTNVDTMAGGFEDRLARVKELSGTVDVFVLFAVLEHMTLSERLTTLEAAAGALSPGGAIVVGETPNRLLWNDYHTTETPFFGMLPDELVLELAGSVRRTELAQKLTDRRLAEVDRRHVLTRWGRGVSHHEFEAIFGRQVHDHVIATGWDPDLLIEREVHPEEVYLAKFMAVNEPHVASCFSRHWLDFVLQPGSELRRSLPRPFPLHSLGSDGVTITPWESAMVSSGGVLRVELPGPTTKIAVNVLVGPDRPDQGPRVTVTSSAKASTLQLDAHRPGQWSQQAAVSLPAPASGIAISSPDGAIDVTALLWWPMDDGTPVEPLSVRTSHRRSHADRATVEAPRLLPLSPASEPLHGTYVGNKRVLVRVRGGGRLLVSADDLTLMPELVTEGGYDAPFTAFLRRVLRPDSVFVDVGANVGLFTVVGALQAWCGRVVAYEPASEIVDLLRDNVQLNWLLDRVTVRPVAVADRPGTRPFHFDRRLQLLGGLSAAGAEASTGVVDVVTLDDELREFEQIDLVKIDVEGGEAEVIAGMARLLEAGRVARISCEVRSDAFERVGRHAEWPLLVRTLERMENDGWTFALIGADGSEQSRSVEEIVASEPHPNVVAQRPRLALAS